MISWRFPGMRFAGSVLMLGILACSRVATVPPVANPTEPASYGAPAPESVTTDRPAKASPGGDTERGSAEAARVMDAAALPSSPGEGRRPSGWSGTQAATVKAGTHDDNEEYPSWVMYTSRKWLLPNVLTASYYGRVVVRIVDSDGAPLSGRNYTVRDAAGMPLWEGVTYANGESVIFPSLFWPNGGTPASLVCRAPGTRETAMPWQPSLDGFVTLRLPVRRAVMQRIPVDVAFVVDATGSMGDEIQQLRDVLFSIHSRLQSATQAADIRFGMVVYRDRGDAEPLRVVPFTANVDSFQIALEAVQASGGGDTPEDIHTGLRAALKDLVWRDGSIRNAFLIADAPPHTDYGQDYDYLWASRLANKMSIRVNTVGASGLDQSGEYVFRQLSVATYGQFIFLTYGESGESSGAGTVTDPGRVSHHTGGNWAARRLDDIVVDLVRRDIAYQTSVPLLVTDSPAPGDQTEHLTARMENLWQQVRGQLAGYTTDTLTAVLLPFENELNDSARLAGYLRDLSTETLVKMGSIRVVERDRLSQIMEEQNLSVTGVIEPSQAVELGHLLNSRVVFVGKVYRLGTDRVVHVRAVATETGQIIAAARVRV